MQWDSGFSEPHGPCSWYFSVPELIFLCRWNVIPNKLIYFLRRSWTTPHYTQSNMRMRSSSFLELYNNQNLLHLIKGRNACLIWKTRLQISGLSLYFSPGFKLDAISSHRGLQVTVIKKGLPLRDTIAIFFIHLWKLTKTGESENGQKMVTNILLKCYFLSRRTNPSTYGGKEVGIASINKLDSKINLGARWPTFHDDLSGSVSWSVLITSAISPGIGQGWDHEWCKRFFKNHMGLVRTMTT